jgi:hypothetical protein
MTKSCLLTLSTDSNDVRLLLNEEENAQKALQQLMIDA